MIVPVILSGGVGTRLWPLSRSRRPKQLSRLGGSRTMLTETAARAAAVPGAGPPIVVCNAIHVRLVVAQMAEERVEANAILAEPQGRNTAPAVAFAALTAAAMDPVLLVLPADHVIKDTAAFTAAVQTGMAHAEAGRLVTFGIVPDRPHTGYGYIEQGEALGEGTSRLARFVEKPDAATAAAYVESGRYLWNSGMFMFRASVYLEELSRFAPDMLAGCRAAVAGAQETSGALLLDATAVAETPADSVDYAVMEHTDRGVVVGLDAGWSDVGAWTALWEISDKDGDGNVLIGDVVAQGVTGSYIRSESRLVTVVGVDGLIVVETPDAVLVVPRTEAQRVREIVDRLEGRTEIIE